MKNKLLILILIILFSAKLGFAQKYIDNNEKFQILSKLNILLSKNKYIEELLKNVRLVISKPGRNLTFYYNDNIDLSWYLDFKGDPVANQFSDNEATVAYYWKIDLYQVVLCGRDFCDGVFNREIALIPLKNGTSLNYRWKIPANLFGLRYFFRISLINSFGNKIVKVADSEQFRLVGSFRSNNAGNIYKGILLKLNRDYYNISPYILISNNKVYILKTYFNLDRLVNKFIIIQGKEFNSGIKDIIGLDVFIFYL